MRVKMTKKKDGSVHIDARAGKGEDLRDAFPSIFPPEWEGEEDDKAKAPEGASEPAARGAAGTKGE